MHSDSGHTTSLWMATADVPSYPPLTADAECDVCIVGAGISGLSVAYALAKRGQRVLVVDDGPVGGGETARTTAHLSSAFDDRYHAMESMHGALGARLLAESHSAAIDWIESVVREENIDCDFARLDGYLVSGAKGSRAELEKERDAVHRAGLIDVTLVDRAPAPWPETGPALRFPRQAQFHVLEYLAGLCAAITRRGGRIVTGSHVTEVVDARLGARARVRTRDGHTVEADAIVVATNSPINDWVAIHTKQAAYRSYVIGARVPTGVLPLALFWDTSDPYHYVRLQRGAADGDDVLIVGGEDHKTGQKHDQAERFQALEDWTRQHFPVAGAVEYRWSGQVMEPVDGVGFIGVNPGNERVFVVTGDSGQGMTHGTIAALLLPALIADEEHAWATLYDPSRVTLSLRSAATFVKENLNVAAQFRKNLSGGDVADAGSIARGEGAVLRRGTHKIACYRDEQGALHERSAICPHLYCVVDWNGTEKTWDCPCHGSRFDAWGRVVNGPASADLGELDDESAGAPLPPMAS